MITRLNLGKSALLMLQSLKPNVAVSIKTQKATIPDTTAKTLTEALRPALAPDAVLCTDGNSAYAIVAQQIGIQSGSFVASYHGKGGIGIWHVQGVNRYDSSLKTWMRRFNGVATKYLHHYLGWRRLLDRFHDQLTPKQFLFHAIRDYYVEQT